MNDLGGISKHITTVTNLEKSLRLAMSSADAEVIEIDPAAELLAEIEQGKRDAVIDAGSISIT